MAEIRPKRCKMCGDSFLPTKPLQRVCGPSCAFKDARQKRLDKESKALRVDDRRRKVDMRTVGDWKKLVQAEFNRFIRNRDYFLPCVSCHTVNPKYTGRGGAWDCGHYLSRGARPELRFEELNCAKQCKKCNSFGSGRIQDYRIELIIRIGQDKVDWLEGPHPAKQYTKADLIELLAVYKAKAKANTPEIVSI